MDIKVTTSGGPRCPECDCMLQREDKNKWRCSVGDILLDVKVDEADKKIKLNKFGHKMTTFIISGEGHT